MRNGTIQRLADICGKSYDETEKIVDKMKCEFKNPSREQASYERKLELDRIVDAYFSGQNLKEVLKEAKECK